MKIPLGLGRYQVRKSLNIEVRRKAKVRKHSVQLRPVVEKGFWDDVVDVHRMQIEHFAGVDALPAIRVPERFSGYGIKLLLGYDTHPGPINRLGLLTPLAMAATTPDQSVAEGGASG